MKLPLRPFSNVRIAVRFPLYCNGISTHGRSRRSRRFRSARVDGGYRRLVPGKNDPGWVAFINWCAVFANGCFISVAGGLLGCGFCKQAGGATITPADHVLYSPSPQPEFRPVKIFLRLPAIYIMLCLVYGVNTRCCVYRRGNPV